MRLLRKNLDEPGVAGSTCDVKHLLWGSKESVITALEGQMYFSFSSLFMIVPSPLYFMYTPTHLDI